MANPAEAMWAWPGFVCSWLGREELMRQWCLGRVSMHAVIRKYTASPDVVTEARRRSAVFTGINVYRLECGQIVQGWSEPDALGLLRQLGAVPEIAPVGATPVS
jgi:hypothetical protein